MKERPSRHVLTEKEVEVLVNKHFPQYSGVSSADLRKMLVEKYAHSEHADLSFENVDRQLKNPNSLLSKAMYALCVTIRVTEIISQQTYALQRFLAERERFEQLPANAAKNHDVVEVVKENLAESDHILVTNAEIIKQLQANRDLINKSQESMSLCLLTRHQLLAQRAAHKAVVVNEFNKIVEADNLSPAFKMTGVLQHRINLAYVKAAKASGIDVKNLDSNVEFNQIAENAIKEDLEDFAEQKLDNGEVTRLERRQFLGSMEQLLQVAFYGARQNHRTNYTLDELMEKLNTYHAAFLIAQDEVVKLKNASTVNQKSLDQRSDHINRGLNNLSPVNTKPTPMRSGHTLEELERLRGKAPAHRQQPVQQTPAPGLPQSKFSH